MCSRKPRGPWQAPNRLLLPVSPHSYLEAILKHHSDHVTSMLKNKTNEKLKWLPIALKRNIKIPFSQEGNFGVSVLSLGRRCLSSEKPLGGPVRHSIPGRGWEVEPAEPEAGPSQPPGLLWAVSVYLVSLHLRKDSQDTMMT